MGKPLNLFAIAMWVIAALAAANLCWFVWGANGFMEMFITVTRSLATAIGPLVALGVLIELADQIRWNALPPEQRKPFGFKL